MIFWFFDKKWQKILEIWKVRAGYVASGGPAPLKNDPQITKSAQKYSKVVKSAQKWWKSAPFSRLTPTSLGSGNKDSQYASYGPGMLEIHLWWPRWSQCASSRRNWSHIRQFSKMLKNAPGWPPGAAQLIPRSARFHPAVSPNSSRGQPKFIPRSDRFNPPVSPISSSRTDRPTDGSTPMDQLTDWESYGSL